MRVKVYQILPEKDEHHCIFLGSSDIAEVIGEFKVDPAIYYQVFDAVIDEIDLEDIFRRFNTTGHPLYRGSSMSVSDVIVTEDGAYFCDSIGFKKIDFDESQASVSDSLFRIVYVEPHKPAYESWIEDSLEAEQKAVGGFIELIYNDDDTLLVGNDEAKLIGMKGNRYLDDGAGIIAGAFFVIGDDGENFRSLTDEETEKYLKKYAVPEDISDEDTQNDVGFVIYEF